MTRLFVSLISAFLIFITPAYAAVDKDFVNNVKNATAILYSQNSSGSMNMHCTATAFERTKVGYLFVSAAHCIGNDDKGKERVAEYKNIPFYITFDKTEIKTFYAAKVVGVGYQHRGDDFAVFEVETKADWPTVPLGDERKEEAGAEVLNVASPLGLGLQVFHGSITNLELDRPIVEGDINWKGSVVLQIQAGPGSSGSSVISVKQKAIVAFLVGTIGGNNIVAIPVSKFLKFRELSAAGKYRWARPNEDE